MSLKGMQFLQARTLTPTVVFLSVSIQTNLLGIEHSHFDFSWLLLINYDLHWKICENDTGISNDNCMMWKWIIVMFFVDGDCWLGCHAWHWWLPLVISIGSPFVFALKKIVPSTLRSPSGGIRIFAFPGVMITSDGIHQILKITTEGIYHSMS